VCNEEVVDPEPQSSFLSFGRFSDGMDKEADYNISSIFLRIVEGDEKGTRSLRV
jgi:hypothetical protein